MGIRLRDRAEVLIPVRTADPANPRRRRPDWTVDPAETIPVRFEAAQSTPVVTAEQGSALTSWTGQLPPHARLDDGTVVDLVAKVTKACRIRWHGADYALEEISPHRRGSRVRFMTIAMRRV